MKDVSGVDKCNVKGDTHKVVKIIISHGLTTACSTAAVSLDHKASSCKEPYYTEAVGADI